jgi:hypothetical protein
VFAPYFPPEDPHKFAIVHKVFGASNVSKMLQVGPLLPCLALYIYVLIPYASCSSLVVCSQLHQELPAQQRADAVSSLVYEANARVRDPVYGCVGAISYLQHQVSQLQMQLALAEAEILCVQAQHDGCATDSSSPPPPPSQQYQPTMLMEREAYGSHQLMQNGLMNTLNSSSAAAHRQQQQQMLGNSVVTLREACLKKESLWT